MSNDQKIPAAGNGPGSTLAQARTEMGLSHQEVATRLHLAPRQIAALDADDYDHLPGPTYVRGYLRSYAELLGLPPGPILESYAKLFSSQPPPDFTTIAPKEQITSQHRQMKLATYMGMAVIIGLVIAWWQSKEGAAPAPSAIVDADAPDPAMSKVELPPLVEAVPDASGLPAPPSPFAPPSSGTAGSTAPPASAVAPPAVPPPTLIGPTPPPSAPQAAASPPPPPPPPPAVTQSPVTEPPVAIGPRVRLVIHTDEESWVDVRDARQNKLLYETVPPGRSISLEGSAPLSVFLGNVAGVRVEYNGQSYDASRHQRGPVARFTLGRDLIEN